MKIEAHGWSSKYWANATAGTKDFEKPTEQGGNSETGEGGKPPTQQKEFVITTTMVPTTERNNTGKGTDSNQLPAKEFEPPMARDGATKWEQKACTIDTTGRTTETGNAKSANEDDGRNPSEEQPNEKNAFPDDDERSNPYINNKDERRNPSEEQPNKMKVYQTRTTSVQIGVAELKVEGESLPCAKVVDESLPFEMGVLYDKVEGEDLPCATVVDESLPFEVGVIYDKVADVSLPFAKAVDGSLLNSLNDRFLSTCQRMGKERSGVCWNRRESPFCESSRWKFPFRSRSDKGRGKKSVHQRQGGRRESPLCKGSRRNSPFRSRNKKGRRQESVHKQ